MVNNDSFIRAVKGDGHTSPSVKEKQLFAQELTANVSCLFRTSHLNLATWLIVAMGGIRQGRTGLGAGCICRFGQPS